MYIHLLALSTKLPIATEMCETGQVEAKDELKIWIWKYTQLWPWCFYYFVISKKRGISLKVWAFVLQEIYYNFLYLDWKQNILLTLSHWYKQHKCSEHVSDGLHVRFGVFCKQIKRVVYHTYISNSFNKTRKFLKNIAEVKIRQNCNRV